MGVYVNIDVKEIRRGAVAILNIDDVAFFVNGKDIIAVPDHGELIDRDALNTIKGKTLLEAVYYAPVVIPAERSKDGET